MKTPGIEPGAEATGVKLRLKEWSKLQPGPVGDSKKLVGLSLHSEADRAIAFDMARAGVVTVTEVRHGLAIETKSFIGRLAIGPLDLTIEPKLSWGRWLTLVGYALKLRGLVRADRIDVEVESLGLQNLIILELIAESRDLLARGLHRAYVSRRELLTHPRGRIDFARIAKKGGIRAAALPCRFTKRTDDSILNQALLAGLIFAASFASDHGLRNAARRLAKELESTVHSHPLSDEIISKAYGAIDRRTARYGAAMRLIRLLHEGQSVTLDDQTDRPRVSLPGFALDMNRIWQQLLGRALREWSETKELREEFALRGIFQRNPKYPLRRTVPRPRPDFAVFEHGALVTFLDAKYRDLWERSLPREMLYQLALYAMAQGSGVVAMLYPTESLHAVEQRIDIRDPLTDSIRASIALRPVDLSSLEELITAPSTMERADARLAFSRSLVSHES